MRHPYQWAFPAKAFRVLFSAKCDGCDRNRVEGKRSPLVGCWATRDGLGIFPSVETFGKAGSMRKIAERHESSSVLFLGSRLRHTLGRFREIDFPILFLLRGRAAFLSVHCRLA